MLNSLVSSQHDHDNMSEDLKETHNRHPIACLWGQAMGCFLWVLLTRYPVVYEWEQGI